MKAPLLLRVEQGPEKFEPLLKAAGEAGLRVGWLELASAAEAPAELEAAAAKGVLRAVAVGGGRTIAVKPVRGKPVLRDLLREYFLGCALVLVAGDVEAPRIEPDGDGWLVHSPGGKSRRFEAPVLVEALRKPRPFS